MTDFERGVNMSYNDTGFLRLACPKCGKEFTTYLRSPMDSITCRCGEDIPLDNLAPVSFKCECGRKWFMRTNKTENMFDVECSECKYLVTVVYNSKRGKYVDLNYKR